MATLTKSITARSVREIVSRFRTLQRDRRRVARCFSSALPQPVTENKAVTPPTKKAVDFTSKDDLQRFTRQRKPETNAPFIKNLFLGNFIKGVLVYPELVKDEVQMLDELIAPVEKFFNEAVDSKLIDETSEIPEKVLQQLKDLGLFGQQIPQEYGGLGLNATQICRIAEITGLDASIAVTLAAHQYIGLKGILIAGTDEQKQQYLPKLSTGEHIAAFCLTEPTSGSDAASIQTQATLSEDGSTFHLNGSKIWISNGGIADVFTVLAKTEIIQDGEPVDKITAFIVERAFGGVTSGPPEDKLGLRGSNTCEVFFDNTPVPVENVIGEVGGGFKIAMNILNSGRFSMGSAGAGGIKRLIQLTTEHAISRKQFGKSLSEFGLIQEKLAKMTRAAYAMESMAYLTASIIDQFEEPDTALEAAIVKVYSSENGWECVSEALQIMGGMGYMKAYPFERVLRDSRISLIFEGTNEVLRCFIALSGLKFATKDLKELIKKLRQPLNNPGLAFKSTWEYLRGKTVNPPMTLFLSEEVHPSLKDEANILETNTLRLSRVVRHVLKTYANKIIDEQLILKRLADCVIDLYVMTACIGRASRSHCIGLRHSDHEIQITRVICWEADRDISQRIDDIYKSATLNMDDNNRQIAELVIKNHGYAATHPLTRNW